MLKEVLRAIAAALDQVVGGVQNELNRRFDVAAATAFNALKPFEDALDAIVAAWVGSTILEGRAEAFGDDKSAIWIPRKDWRRSIG